MANPAELKKLVLAQLVKEARHGTAASGRAAALKGLADIADAEIEGEKLETVLTGRLRQDLSQESEREFMERQAASFEALAGMIEKSKRLAETDPMLADSERQTDIGRLFAEVKNQAGERVAEVARRRYAEGGLEWLAEIVADFCRFENPKSKPARTAR